MSKMRDRVFIFRKDFHIIQRSILNISGTHDRLAILFFAISVKYAFPINHIATKTQPDEKLHKRLKI